jgi:hypothetical protein
MKLMPIVYVTNMERSVEFYRAFCDTVRSQSAMWTEFAIGDARFALHFVTPLPKESRIELAFLATAPLEQVVAALEKRGISLERAITDEAFGRSILVRDPDGLPIQINEHDPEFYA